MLCSASVDGTQIAVLDINDAKQKEHYEKARRQELGHEEYQRLYNKLPHMFYERSWFVTIAEKHNLEHAIMGQSIPG